MLKNLNNDEKNELRKAMGTLPEDNTEFSDTIVFRGVSGINVELYDWPRNYAQVLAENVVATWGNECFATKWPTIKPELRFLIAKAVLTGATLPQAQEGLQFSFIVRGTSRAAFDQHARARLGTFFQSQGVRDNSRLDASFRMPNETWEDPAKRERVFKHITEWKREYQKILKEGEGSFQEARQIFPMNATHNYKFGANFMALKAYCAQRLMACEQADTVQVSILVRAAVKEYSPYLASLLQPRCDQAKKCVYHQDYTLSEAFGCLFKGCGRWPDTTPYATHNKSCSDYDQMGKESGLRLEHHTDWKHYSNYEDLEQKDKDFFNEEWKSIKVGQDFSTIHKNADALTRDDMFVILKLEDEGYAKTHDIRKHVERYLK